MDIWCFIIGSGAACKRNVFYTTQPVEPGDRLRVRPNPGICGPDEWRVITVRAAYCGFPLPRGHSIWITHFIKEPPLCTPPTAISTAAAGTATPRSRKPRPVGSGTPRGTRSATA